MRKKLPSNVYVDLRRVLSETLGRVAVKCCFVHGNKGLSLLKSAAE
jgi:hypothetical protein